MKKAFCSFLLRLLGWKIGSTEGVDTPKCVICVAPHTSNMDFWLGELYYGAIGCHASFLIKKEWFRFPFNIIFGPLGGVPVDRDKHSSITDQMAECFRTHEHFQLAVTPEGSRKRNEEWRKGFYYIALKANVPILIAYIDYAKKELGMMRLFQPTGNADADIHAIREMYRGVTACHPADFSQV
jgi:1-acyl-sn-glycerol-3-phosphate acyltransferase